MNYQAAVMAYLIKTTVTRKIGYDMRDHTFPV